MTITEPLQIKTPRLSSRQTGLGAPLHHLIPLPEIPMANTPDASVTDLDDDSDTSTSATAQPASEPDKILHKPSAAPASDPTAAVAQPASEITPVRARTVISSVRDPGIDFEDNPELVLRGMSPEKTKDYMRKVSCHVTESFKGRVQGKEGRMEPFSFVKHEVVSLPKWFALSHSQRLVIKE